MTITVNSFNRRTGELRQLGPFLSLEYGLEQRIRRFWNRGIKDFGPDFLADITIGSGDKERSHSNLTKAEALDKLREALAFPCERVVLRLPGDRLSAVCSDLVKEARKLEAMENDIAAFHAPRECFRLEVLAYGRSCRRAILARYATIGEFYRDLEDRISAKAIHRLGLPEEEYLR